MSRLSLGDIRAIHRQQGALSFIPKITGYVQATKRDINTGEITGSIAEHNLVTSAPFDWWAEEWDRRLYINRYIFISNEVDQPDSWKSIYYNTYQDVSKLIDTAGAINTASLYWTFQVTFSAPTAPGRTIRNIGICAENDDIAYLNARMAVGVFCVARLTSDLFQSNTESLEVVYRLTFQQAV